VPWGSEIGRRAVGFILGTGIRSYGAAAALSVAFSDAETVSGKCHDAFAAVPNLTERYRETRYVVDHREQIRTALDYVHQHAPDPQQLQTAAHKSSETLVGIETTYNEVMQAKDALGTFNVFKSIPEAAGHLDNAWAAKPDLGSIRHLAGVADGITPFLNHVNVLVPRLYGGLLTGMDNFASDEIAATVGVMGAALGLAFVLAQGVGFWARRGRPGIVARTLQTWGARRYRGWYVRNLERVLSRPLYAAARERILSDIVEDPQKALDPEALHKLEQHFGRRLEDYSTAAR
jgi:hypothetical protein